MAALLTKNLLASTILLILLTHSLHGVTLKSSGTHLFVGRDKSERIIDHYSAFARNRRSSDNTNTSVKILRYHMTSMVYSRFATVTIKSEVNNTAVTSEEIAFTVQIPETAFMSNFTMLVNGQLFEAEVMEKAAAQKQYDDARAQNQTAGQVKQDSIVPEKGMQLFTINVNLAPQGTAIFTLVYNELLERVSGKYYQRMVVKPGMVVPDLEVSAMLTEQQGFISFTYTLPGATGHQVGTTPHNFVTLTSTPTFHQFLWTPDEAYQRNRHHTGLRGESGELKLTYTINNEANGGNVIAQDNYFVHFFAPPDLEPLDANFLFVVDISGSMGSQGKIQKALSAMEFILDEMKVEALGRLFNILLFDDTLEQWKEEAVRLTLEQVESAKKFCYDRMRDRGGTNIHQALMTGLDMVLKGRDNNPCSTVNAIVFLSDGDPTSGVTSTSKITRDVTAKNNGRVSIYTLGFGFDMKFEFLKAVAYHNRGFANRIFVDDSAAFQLQGFYRTISRPTLCNVEASYNVDVVEENELSVRDFPVYYEGQEIVVAGKTLVKATDLDAAAMTAEMTGIGAQGDNVNYYVPVQNVHVITNTPYAQQDMAEKLWAYLRIRSMLREIEALETEAEKEPIRAVALNMSLAHRFVTPLTSFSIVARESSSTNDDGLEHDFMMNTLTNDDGLEHDFTMNFLTNGVSGAGGNKKKQSFGRTNNQKQSFGRTNDGASFVFGKTLGSTVLFYLVVCSGVLAVMNLV